MIKNFSIFINESVGDSKNLKEELLKSTNLSDFCKIIEKTYIEVDDLGYLDSTKEYLTKIGFRIDKYNMFKELFRPNEGFGCDNKKCGRWGTWDDCVKYQDRWDYRVKISDFADIINSILNYSNYIIKKKKKIIKPDIDPYGEEDWDDDN